MKKTLEHNITKSRLSKGLLSGEMTEIRSLDEIPEFDTPEAEAIFWKTHRMSKELLDQIPNAAEPEE